jgi:hypothetical protein
MMLVRAHCRQDAFNLFNDHQAILPSMIKPASDESRDYRWRLSINRDDWITLAGRPAAAVDYTNFKSEGGEAVRSTEQVWALSRNLGGDARLAIGRAPGTTEI